MTLNQESTLKTRPGKMRENLSTEQPAANETSLDTWNSHYVSGKIPWRSSGLSSLTRRYLKQYAAGRDVLEVGCGTGDDSTEIVDLDFNYLGIDASPAAIARAASTRRTPQIRFLLFDFFAKSSLAPFDVIYEKGVFHGLAGVRRRSMFARRVAIHLRPSGIWISICGSADIYDPNFSRGAIYLRDLVAPVEPYLEVLEVVKAPYGLAEVSHEFVAWHAVFRRR